ncbi:MAG: hypothetical protein IPQ07_12920 [Myxococcales bacterium]|nr:hypothetical protein [Myxococcales bacterium]
MILAKGGGDPNIVRDAASCTLAIFGALTAFVLILLEEGLLLMRRARDDERGGDDADRPVAGVRLQPRHRVWWSAWWCSLRRLLSCSSRRRCSPTTTREPVRHAALALFSSIALMFLQYIIQIFLRASRE